MKKIFVKIIKKIAPPSFHFSLHYHYQKIKGRLDPEMHYVNGLLVSRRRFIDVGANSGLYSYHFSANFKYVDAFEPIPEITFRLANSKKKNIKRHFCALSNTDGELQFYIPLHDGVLRSALASLEPREGPCERRIVKVKKLDDFKFDDVDLIKIDVEGHEFDVIDGATETIKKTYPILIVEIEQRHIDRPINDVFNLIFEIGYKGYFLQDGQLIDIKNFSYSRNQEPYINVVMDSRYINNFIFIPCKSPSDN